MEPYQQKFLDFAIDRGVLRFGEFVLKSGRNSPYFFNAGLFDSGAALSRLGRYYAEAIVASGIEFEMLFGPAYKGIPLVTATAIALHEGYDRDVPIAFNRKEVKDHGEGGLLVGAPVAGRVLVVDDVISAGLSVAESVKIIEANGGQMAGVVIALDRQERGQGNQSAVAEVESRYGVPVTSVVNLDGILEYLGRDSERARVLERVRQYQSEY
ncbi:MAG: orotate phosphoribosyltransferase, partial [Gammaproteobacteria bacterium]|nr:orotate phosphoribosyltransferase [Gammaproteobacteria bacterium]